MRCGPQHIVSVYERYKWPLELLQMGHGIWKPYERESKKTNSQLSLLLATSEIYLNVYNALNLSNKTLSDINQQKTNYVLATRHFYWVFNLIYCTKMPARPKASPFPGHEYSNEMFNLCLGDYWKATEACRILPKACLKPCYALDWMTCWDTKS